MTLNEIYNQPMDDNEKESASFTLETILRHLPKLEGKPSDSALKEDVDWTATGKMIATFINNATGMSDEMRFDVGLALINKIKQALQKANDSTAFGGLVRGLMREIIIPPRIASLLVGLMR